MTIFRPFSKDDYPQLPISLTDRVDNSFPFDAKTIRWPDFVTIMRNFSTYPYPEKSAAPLFSPTIFKSGHRSHAEAGLSGMAVLDSDGGVTVAEVHDWFQAWQFEALIYSSGRNRPAEPKWRLAIPFAVAVDRFDHYAATEAIYRILRAEFGDRWKIDTTKFNSGDLYYVPGSYQSATADNGEVFAPSNEFVHLSGRVLSAQDWIEIADEIAPKPAEEIVERIDFTLRNDVAWTLPDEIADRYLGLTDGRNIGRFAFAVSAAMSAFNAGYDIGEGELLALVEDMQRRNPGNSRHTRRGLQRLVHSALDDARRQVPDPAFARQTESSYQFEYPRNPDTSRPWWERDFDIDDGENDNDPPPDDDPEPAGEDPFAALWPNAEDDKNCPPLRYVIDKLIPEDCDVYLFGPTGSLKSFIVTAILESIATGKPVLTREVNETGPVFYFAGEGYRALRTKRRAAWEIHHGYEPFTVPDIWFAQAVPYVNNPKLVDSYVKGMKARLEGRPCAAFAVDTLNRALNGEDEDKSNVAAKYLNLMQAIRKEVGGVSITVGHTGWDTSRSRGSSAYPANYDVILQVTRNHYDPETKTHTVEIRVNKMKDDEPGDMYWLQTVKVDTPHGDSLALVECDREVACEILDGARSTATTNGNSNRPEGCTAHEFEAALMVIAPDGGIVKSGKVVAEIVRQSDGQYKTNTVEAHIIRNRESGQKFNRYWVPGKGYRLPIEAEPMSETLRKMNEESRADGKVNIFH